MRRLRVALMSWLAAATLLVVGTAWPAAAAVPVSAAGTWQVHGSVYAVTYAPNSGRSVAYVGGSFDSVLAPSGTGASPRRNVAAINAATGVPIAWSPAVAGTVRAIAASPDGRRVYLGGDLTAVTPDGRTQKYLVAVSPQGDLLNWHPTLTATVRALAVSPDGSRLYVGGSFGKANGVPRQHLAAYKTGTGTLDTAWAPNPQGTNTYNEGRLQPSHVNALALSADGATLFVGGVFTTIGGASRTNGAAVRTAGTGSATGFHPQKLTYVVLVTELSSSGAMAYFGGRGPGGFMSGYKTAGTGAPAWYRHFDGDVQAGTVHGSLVYVGGHFQNVRNANGTLTPRGHLAALDATTGALDPWSARANSNLGVFGMDAAPGYLGVGGVFTKINLQPRQGFAEFVG